MEVEQWKNTSVSLETEEPRTTNVPLRILKIIKANHPI